MENLVLKAVYRSTYPHKTTKNDVNVYSLEGSPEAVATYIADKVQERGSCPFMDEKVFGEGVPRLSTVDNLGAEAFLERSVNGKWYAERTVEKALEGKLKQKNLDERVANAIANAYVNELTNTIKSQLASKRRSVTVATPTPTEATPSEAGKKAVDEIF
jgi:hypothetical protein